MRRLDRDVGTVIVVACALLLGLLASWLWAGRVRTAQAQERSDLNLFLDASSAGWAEVTDQFFHVPEAAALTVGALMGEMETDDDRIVLLAESIRTSSALDAAFIGYPDGEFLFVARSDEEAPGGFRTRSIELDANRRTVELTWTNAALEVVRSEFDEDDSYDPRERPWYIDGGDGVTTMWTAPYVFASSQQPGITHSAAVLDAAGNPVAVVGIDIRLTQLGEFLDLLAPGPNGEALVVDEDGQVIAASTMDAVTGVAAAQGALSPSNTGGLGDAIDYLAESGAPFWLDRTEDEQRTTVVRSARANEQWYLAVEALDEDFLGDFSNGSAKNLFGIAAVGAATAIVAAAAGVWALSSRRSLKSEAEFDELTGLLSRRAFNRVLTKNLRDVQKEVVVAIVDLDRFKLINDTYGHAVGDSVLAGLAARIATFGEGSTVSVGRLGGDEFAVAATESLPWDALVNSLSDPIHVGQQEFSVGASIGVAVSKSGHVRSTEEILRQADHALFEVKRAGGNDVRIADATAR